MVGTAPALQAGMQIEDRLIRSLPSLFSWQSMVGTEGVSKTLFQSQAV